MRSVRFFTSHWDPMSGERHESTNMAGCGDFNFVPTSEVKGPLPRRKSARLEATTTPEEVEEKPKVVHSYIWTPNEKKALLEAMKKHGCSDPKKLALKVRSKSVNEIKVYLRRNTDRVRSEHLKKMADYAENEHGESSNNDEDKRCNLMSAMPPIDLWKRIVSGLIQQKHKNPDYSLVLAELWKKFGEEEVELDIPNSPNFKAIYKFMEDALRGTLPANLSPVDTCVIQHLLQKIYEFGAEQKDIAKFLEEFDGPVPIVPSSAEHQHNREEEENPSEIASKELQDDAKWKDNPKRLVVPDHIYKDYCRHQKVKENLNPMGIEPAMLHKTAEAIAEFIERSTQTK